MRGQSRFMPVIYVANVPELMADWDRENARKPEATSLVSSDPVRWRCAKCDHRWEASPRCRSSVVPEGVERRASRGRDCVRCASVGMMYTKLLDEWHEDNDPKYDPFLLPPGSHERVKWRCSVKECGYEWSTTIAHRAKRKHGCEKCLGRIPSATHNAALKFPHLAKEWHPTLNSGKRLEDFTPRSNQYAWWKCIPVPAEGRGPSRERLACSESHEWRASIGNRAKTGCPYLKGPLVPFERSLRVLRPDIADELDVLRNGDEMRAEVLGCSSDALPYWKCPTCGYSYQRSVDSRVKGNSCGQCSGRKVTDDSNLRVKNRELCEEWNEERNLADPPTGWSQGKQFRPENLPPKGSHWSAWWKCRNCHADWQAPIANRACHGHECPECGLHRSSRREILLAFEIGAFLPVGLGPEDRTIVAGGRRWSVDVPIKDLRIVVEYDGAFWHGTDAASERDVRKTNALVAEGWRVLRVRERPLDTLKSAAGALDGEGGGYTDVAVSKDDPAHAVAATALEEIHGYFGVSIPGLRNYIDGDSPRRDREARAYIDKLLSGRT
jgi:hypothetical protein